MWIPIVYYCGLNQFIVQRTLAAKSLRQGQLGIMLAAGLWLIVPFAIVLPGIAARTLYKADLAAEADKDNAKELAAAETELVVFRYDEAWRTRQPEEAARIDRRNEATAARAAASGQRPVERSLLGYKFDAAYPILIRKLMTPGLRGLMFAAIAGAVISSLASMLNSASTIFTMDLFKRHLRPGASQPTLVTIGRAMTLAFVCVGCFLAPALAHPRFKGVFNFIQEFQGYISPGIVAAFVVGFAVKRAPAWAGAVALLASAPMYGALHIFFGGGRWSVLEIHFLVRMMITFVAVSATMLIMTAVSPLDRPLPMPVREDLDTRPSPLALGLGALAIAGVVLFFVVFR
jgi:SSS family solute:Na+ symporter